MTAGFLEFFVLEASECVERLDGLLAHPAAPDALAFGRDARALRGSATMAKVTGIADLASALERVAKGLRERDLDWNERLRGALVAAVDDLKILLRGVRAWGSAEEARAAERLAELNGIAPALDRPLRPTVAADGTHMPMTAAMSTNFLAAETADIAAGLRRFAEQSGPIATLADTVRRIRALRGVAALNDLPSLAEVVATVDDTAKSLELGATLTDAHRTLFRAAADVLREGSDAMHAQGRPDPDSPAVHAFTVAAADDTRVPDADDIVPISTLFPSGEGHVLHTAPNPPTTPAQRFRLEAVSQSEHLLRLVSEARHASDAPTRQRLGNGLRTAVRSLARAAESFGEQTIAQALHAVQDGAALLEGRALETIERLVRDRNLIGGGTEDAAQKAAPVSRAPDVVKPAVVKPPTTTPMTFPQATNAPQQPSGPALHDLLGAGIAGLSGLNKKPLSEPTIIEEELVPIDALLYRGGAALDRAVLLGNTFRSAGTPPDATALAELYDLLALAAE